MKISIMTQPLGRNYGGIMQAWALQQVLKHMGHEVVTIDRQLDQPSLAYKAARFVYRVSKSAMSRSNAPRNCDDNLPDIMWHTRAFIADQISMSEPLFSSRQLSAHFDREKYDAVIVGSDQTWRPKYSPNIYNFFLDFLEEKRALRIAYASSFGVDEWEYTDEQTNRCGELVKRFDAISLREDSGVDLCRKYLGVDAVHVLDPTLLLDRQKYIDLIGNERIKPAPSGVYTYFLDDTLDKQELAIMAGRQLSEGVFSIRALNKNDTHYQPVSTAIGDDPRDWLAGFFNARCVLTDSFHGMVFSILAAKPFMVINNAERGAARFKSLLAITENRQNLIAPGESIDFKKFLENFTMNYQRLECAKENSLIYLKRSIGI